MSPLLVALSLSVGQVEAPSNRAALLPPVDADPGPSWVFPERNPFSNSSYYRPRPALGNAAGAPLHTRADGAAPPGVNGTWVGLPDMNGCSCGDFDWGGPRPGFIRRLIQAYRDEFKPKKDEKKDEDKNGDAKNGDEKKDNGKNGDQKSDSKNNGHANNQTANHGKDGNGKDGNGKDEKEEKPEPPRRALPAPFNSPPFPTAEYQGFPLIGVPVSDTDYPLIKAIYGGPCGDRIKESRIKAYGWITASGNWSTADNSNTPAAYWIVPNRFVLDQALIRLEREADTVQTDHIDWGFRSTGFYGANYRYTMAGGWGEEQLAVHNLLYGFDATEQYFNLYVPWVGQGMILTVGRWASPPDIEDQFAPDNYLGTHSLLYSVDIATQTGVMATVMLDEQWTVQAAIHSGADMAPWYQGAMPTGMFGVRWVSADNNDSFYTFLNAINNAEFRYFPIEGQPAGHHNYNIFQTTWQHRFCKECLTKTEAYIMWERNAAVGGTPSIGPFQFNTGGGLGPTVPGLSLNYAVVNYAMFQLSGSDFLTFRNEWARDEHGTRYGFAGNYISSTIGMTHQFNSVFEIRPEIGYYRNCNGHAFDSGAKSDLWLYGLDVIWRF